MKNLKYILSLFFLLSLALPTFAQNGFIEIHKAEQKYENGQNKKALKLLSNAEKMNYGFCGNAWMDADRAINLLRAKIYIDQEDYQLARNSLDSIGLEYKGDNLDSIRIRTYQLEYGKDALSNMIDTSFTNTKMECGEHECFVIIPLTDGENLKLKVNPMTNSDLILIDDEKKKLEIWIARFKESQNYKLIKEKS